MKSRSEVWLSALDELGALCSVDTTRDAVTLTRRVENEGDAFFKVTLPLFAKDLEKSLADGGIPSRRFLGWSRKRLDVYVTSDHGGRKLKKYSHGGTPLFLGGFMDIIFSSVLEIDDVIYGDMLNAEIPPMALIRASGDDETIARIASAIWAVRQLCLMYSKEKELCSDDLVEKAIRRYVEHDKSLMRPL